jgi:hypothetical protein
MLVYLFISSGGEKTGKEEKRWWRGGCGMELSIGGVGDVEKDTI